MCMRIGGQGFALGALLAALMTAPANAACDDGSGCESTTQGIVAGQAATAQAAEEARLAETDNKPLPLVNNRKSGKPRTVQQARNPVDDDAKPDRRTKTAADAPVAEKAKDARAEIRDTDLKADSTRGEADRLPTAPPAAAQAAMPVVSSDEVNEIDAAAQQDPAPHHPSPIAVAQPAAPRISPSVEDMPRLAAARVELPEGTTVASAASQESTSLDKTSLIGKIFIALGGLLTAASAIRMFIG